MKKLFQFLLFLFLYTLSFAQNASVQGEFQKAIDILPQPPNASAIVKNAFFQVNKNTGIPGVNIPLYTIKGKKLSIPVSINYSTNGVKVDDLASRVGMGWSLTAGGVITRVVRGVTDENHPRWVPWGPFDYLWSNYNFMNGVSKADDFTGPDAEPDLFSASFNGNYTSFVFDENMNAVQIPSGNLIIEEDFSANAAWNFRITDESGIKYYFGGAGAVEQTKKETSCGKEYNSYIKNAWYLTKIEHLTGEIIVFNYIPLEYTCDNGISETMELVQEGEGVGGNCGFGQSSPVFTNTSCVNTTRTKGVLLNSIVADITSINFLYGSRTDCTDKLVSAIEINNTYGSINLVKKYTFSYTTYANSPYLTSLQEWPTNLAGNIKHTFEYYKPEERPVRLSKSQDHWGFFNGKNNLTLLPQDPSLSSLLYSNWNYFASATANREPDFNYAVKGMLNRILYPTGGMDSIIYEPNTLYNYSNRNRNTSYSCGITGINYKDLSQKLIPFTLGFPQRIRLNINVTCNITTCDPLHQFGRVTIKTAIGNQVVYDEVFNGGTSMVKDVSLGAGDFVLYLQANGTAITSNLDLTYINTAYLNTPSVGPGVRVKEILSGNSGELPAYKRYYYGDINDLNTSSGKGGFMPLYYKSYESKNFALEDLPNGAWLKSCSYLHTLLYSNSILNLFSYQSNAVSYAYVVESDGENFANGGIRTKFAVGLDQLGTTLWNNTVYESPFVNGSIFYNGKIIEEDILKKKSDGSLITIKSTRNSYMENPAGTKILMGYYVFRKNATDMVVDTTCYSSGIQQNTNFSCITLLQSLLSSFDMMGYTIFSPWIQLQQKTEIVYDENGLNPLTSVTNYSYDNLQYKQVTKIETKNSDNIITQQLFKYPYDFISGTNVYQQMVSKNYIAPAIEISTIKNDGTAYSILKNNYSKWNNTFFAPSSIETSGLGSTLINEGTFQSYDQYGNLVQYTGRDGIVNSIIWGYNNSYPVAKITGADYNLALSKLSVSISQLQTLAGATLRNELNNIRTALPDAQITTMSYLPNVGIDAVVDINKEATYYDYDIYNRLSRVRDNDGYILSKTNYTYAIPPSNPSFKLFFNDAKNQSFTCQSCPSNTIGSSVNYSVPAKKHYSLSSKADANNKAQADIDANGQVNANLKGYCSNTICSGTGYKMVNCNCELGVIVPVSCSDNADGTWIQNYKYKWSDNTMSDVIYTRTMPACIAPQYLRDGCNCYIGVRIYESSTQNANGTWTCVYKWRYTNGTYSQTITEISTTPCPGIE